MDLKFSFGINSSDLRPGDCLIELAPQGVVERFSLLDQGIVLLGHHPGGEERMSSYSLTCASWQAHLLVLSQPNWRPRRIIRPLNVNLDDVLACLIVDGATREAILSAERFRQLLHEVSTTDVLGPVGYRGLEGRQKNRCLVNAIHNRAPRPFGKKDRHGAAREYHDALAKLLLGVDGLNEEERERPTPSVVLHRDDGVTALAEADGPGAMDILYQRGLSRVILVSPFDEQGRRRCTVGQVGALRLEEGLLVTNPPIDWEVPSTVEAGWGGRESIGGGPREGTRLDNEKLWSLLRLK